MGALVQHGCDKPIDMDKAAQRLTVDVIGMFAFDRDFGATDLSKPNDMLEVRTAIVHFELDAAGCLNLLFVLLLCTPCFVLLVCCVVVAHPTLKCFMLMCSLSRRLCC